MKGSIKKVYHGYIYVYNFGEGRADSRYQGTRLVLSIAGLRGNQMICCPLTTKSKSMGIDTKVFLPHEDVACLHEDSVVMTDQIFTLPKDDNLIHCIGKIPYPYMGQVYKALNSSVGTGLLNPEGANPKIERGSLVKYKKDDGSSAFGVVIQNNIGNEYSSLTIVVEATPNFGEKSNGEIIRLGRFNLNHKFITTIDQSTITEKIMDVKRNIMISLTKNYMSIFRGPTINKNQVNKKK